MFFKKLPKHRTFKYVPRYYDPRKEELDAILRDSKSVEEVNDTEELKSRISRKMRNGMTGRIAARKQVMNSNVRLMIIIGFLCLIVYLLLRLNLDTLINYLS